MDIELLRSTWKTVKELGDAVPLRFYSTLFYEHPETRAMFPPAMDWASRGGPGQRDKLMYAIGQAISQVDQLDQLRPVLRKLGADHRRFGITEEAYGWVGQALLQTLADFMGESFTEEVRSAWSAAYTALADEMKAGAGQAAAGGIPPWWDAPLGAVIRRADAVTLTIAEGAGPPSGYSWMSCVQLRHPHRPGLWAEGDAIALPDGRLAITVTVDHSEDLDLAGLSLSRLRPGDAVRIGAPWGATVHEETAPDV